MIQQGKVNVVIDGQWGSTGKGKLVGWLYNHYKIDVAVCDFMPNAGHTYVDDSGRVHTMRLLPMGAVFGVPEVVIGPHAAINKEVLLEELRQTGYGSQNPPGRLIIHPMVPLIEEHHLATEAQQLNHIASTMKGGHAVGVLKVLRDPGKVRFVGDDPDLKRFVGDTHLVVQRAVQSRRMRTVLIESAQGFDLGMNHGWKWPYVTGRDCMIGRLFDNAGVSPKHLGSVIASLRTLPIRVGHTEGGYSGPCYEDQRELTWEEVSTMAGREVCERTTVTKRIRRVFTFSRMQVQRFLDACSPDYAFLNFVNYLPQGVDDPFINQLDDLLWGAECKLMLLGTGPKDSDMAHWRERNKQL